MITKNLIEDYGQLKIYSESCKDQNHLYVVYNEAGHFVRQFAGKEEATEYCEHWINIIRG